MTVSSKEMTLRVMVTDVWEIVEVSASADTTIREFKQDALRRALRYEPRDDDYEVKHAGARILDEQQTVASAGIGPGAPLIVLPVHRRPVR